MSEFKLSKKQTIAWDALQEGPVEEIFFAGGAGAGKSVLICAWQIFRRVAYPGTVGLIGRKTGRTLEDTTLKTFTRIWDEFGRHNAWGVTMELKGRPQDAVFSNGSLIMFRHVDPPAGDPDGHSFGSLELTDLCIDELPECDERVVKILMSRVRHKLINNKRAILFAGNPDDGWCMERYVQNKMGKPVELPPDRLYVPATLEDNPDAEFREQYRKSLDFLDDYDRDRLLKGIWGGQRKNDRPYFYSFSRQMVSSTTQADDAVWFSFDFNVDPCTALIGQKIIGVGCRITMCHQVKGGTKALCEDIVLKGYLPEDVPVFVTGDSSGSKATTVGGTEPGGRHITDYTIILKEFQLSPAQVVGLGSRNHNLAYSARVVNYFFQRVPVEIDPSCRELIKDLETAVRDDAGGLVKDRRANKQDAGDAFRYLIHAWFPNGIADIDRFADLI